MAQADGVPVARPHRDRQIQFHALPCKRRFTDHDRRPEGPSVTKTSHGGRAGGADMFLSCLKSSLAMPMSRLASGLDERGDGVGIRNNLIGQWRRDANSSPVARIPTRGRRVTATSAQFIAAASAMFDAPSRVPAASKTSPSVKSMPLARM